MLGSVGVIPQQLKDYSLQLTRGHGTIATQTRNLHALFYAGTYTR